MEKILTYEEVALATLSALADIDGLNIQRWESTYIGLNPNIPIEDLTTRTIRNPIKFPNHIKIDKMIKGIPKKLEVYIDFGDLRVYPVLKVYPAPLQLYQKQFAATYMLEDISNPTGLEEAERVFKILGNLDIKLRDELGFLRL